MIRSVAAAGLCFLALAAIGGSDAVAGKGAFLPTYHPKPCSGDDCQASDPRSGAPCKGLLCDFSSARALQRPVTASEAAEAEKVRAAAIAAAAATPPPETPVKRKHVVKAKTTPAKTLATRTPAPTPTPAN